MFSFSPRSRIGDQVKTGQKYDHTSGSGRPTAPVAAPCIDDALCARRVMLKYAPEDLVATTSPVSGVRLIAVATKGKDIHVWNTDTGTRELVLPRHSIHLQNETVIMEFSKDGSHLAAAYSNGDVVIWDVSLKPRTNGSRQHTLRGDWRLDDDGWVRDKEGCRVFWVPSDNGHGLLWSRIVSVDDNLKKRMTIIDTSQLVYGAHWARCRTDPEG